MYHHAYMIRHTIPCFPTLILPWLCHCSFLEIHHHLLHHCSWRQQQQKHLTRIGTIPPCSRPQSLRSKRRSQSECAPLWDLPRCARSWLQVALKWAIVGVGKEKRIVRRGKRGQKQAAGWNNLPSSRPGGCRQAFIPAS